MSCEQRDVCRFFGVVTLAGLALTAAPLRAQEEPSAAPHAEERAELEALLAKVEAALAKLEPVVRTRLVQYDVRHLLWRPYDRRAPDLGPPGEAAGWRNGAGGGFTFEDDAEGEGAVLDPDQFVEVVVEAVGRDRWDGPRSIQLHRGFLFVVQTDEAHARIAPLLARLKREETRAVQLEVQFYALSADLQAELERSAAAGDGILVPAALERLDQAVDEDPKQLTGCALLTGLDAQRVFLHRGAEEAFVASYERSSGGTGEVVEAVDDPVVETLKTGLALDVRATILDGARPQVALDVRFTRSHAVSLTQRVTPWGPIDIPQLLVDTVRTSARVPPGSGMLVFSTRGSRDPAQPDVTIVVRPRLVRP